MRYNITNEDVINFCPKLLFVDEEVVDALRLFVYWEKGNLLCSGGVEDQPYWYYICMLKLNEVKTEYEIEKYKEVNNN